MVAKLIEGIYAIDVPLPRNPLRNLNSYLIQGRSRNLLVDTGFNLKACRSALEAGVRELGVSMSRTDIFLTHMHSDHCGLAGVMAGDGTKIMISAADRDWLERLETPGYWEGSDARYLRLGFPAEELAANRSKNPALLYSPPRAFPCTIVSDGDIIDLGGFRLSCLATPGHTPGHMCLYDADRRFLFSGDHILFGISPNITAWPGVTDSLGLYLESLDKIGALPIERTFAAHRQAEGDCLGRIAELKAHHESRLAEALAIVTEEVSATAYEIASKMTWSIRARAWSDFPLAQKWFAVGEAASHLDHLREQSLIERKEESGMYRYGIR
jgi:glyoxylase-like metal-dependent hydrolase (beta-lactamase superfamily II)